MFLNSNLNYLINNSSLILDSSNKKDILIFRRIIETAQRKGFWWGTVIES